jgi:hypothetical protein
MRWKKPDRPEGRWILAVCLPVVDDEGNITSICKSSKICTRDISTDFIIAGCTTDVRFILGLFVNTVGWHLRDLSICT